MIAQRYLIVNGDDFGQSPGINRGVIEAHENGIVTSASLMVRRPAARQAVTYVEDHREMSLGLHLDLGEWEYRAGEWVVVIPPPSGSIATRWPGHTRSASCSGSTGRS